MRANDPDGLLKLSVLMDNCRTSLQSFKHASDIDSMEVMLAVAKKLPVQMREKWVETSIQCETGRRANFAALSDFVAKQSQLANSIFGRIDEIPVKLNAVLCDDALKSYSYL